MASKKAPIERKFVSASSGKAVQPKEKAEGEVRSVPEVTTDGNNKTPKGRATTLRVIAVILWLAAVGFEVLAIMVLNGSKLFLYSIIDNMLVWLIVSIVLDLICVVIGSLLWKKANRIDPASEKNKVKFFLWNNMGVVAAIVAFVPLIVLLLKDKKLTGNMKKIVTVVAAVALVVAVGASIDYNPVSQEDLAQAKQESLAATGDGVVNWTQWGHSYHYDPDCRSLKNSATIYQGSIEEAFEANKTDPCDFCAGGAEAKLEAAENTGE